MLYEEKDIPELHFMKHRHDSASDYVDYENNILNKSLSPYMFMNDRMGTFLTKLQKLMALMFDQFNVIKNWRNYNVDKYYYKHTN